ncbi:MAG: AAA family ATPase [Caldimonas sp.]
MDTPRPNAMQDDRRWRFGPFEVDAGEHRLSRDGSVVPVTRKSFALLATLLGRPGRLFTKAELFETVWAGSVVTDAALSRAIRELRVALGDDAATPRYIATAHGLGFRFVALVSLECGGCAELAPLAPVRQRLVGRDAALARLEQALAEARAGRRQVVFVTGEAGIGKTALVDAFASRHADRAGLWSAQGRCVEQYGTGEAYLPILEALEDLARQVGAAAFRDVLTRYAPAWLAHLPWLAHGADPATLQRALADASAQRMLREIAQAIEVLAADRPILLWLEDLHWSDPSSLAVVAFLAGRREPARLLLLASFRRADASAAESPLPGLAQQLLRRGQAAELALGLLDAGAVADYLRLRFGDGAAIPYPELAAFVHRRTEGHALFTVAIVDDLVRRGSLAEVPGSWRLSAPVAALDDGLPDDLRHLVHDQLARLTDDERRLLEAAAIAGTQFSAAAVAAALQADPAETEDRCARLAQEGRFLRFADAVAWPDGTVASGFSFVHALYWQGTHERIPEGRRAEWQRRIGLRQEEAWGSQSGAIAAELAMRFEAARDVERSVRFLRLAGAGALARCAYQECIDHLRRALALVPKLPAADRPRTELDVLLPLGAALMAVQGYASSEVEATYQRALALCEDCGRPGDLERVQRGLWNVRFSRADLDGARTAAEALRASSHGDTALVFDALSKLGHTALHSGDFTAARTHLERALAMRDDTPASAYRREAPRLLAYLSWALWYLGEPSGALACAQRSLASLDADASVHTRALVLGHAAGLSWLRSEIDAAAAFAEQQHALSVEHGLPYWRAWSDFILGVGAASAGRLDEGLARIRAAVDAVQKMGTVVGTTSWLYVLAEIEIAAGRPAQARAALAGSSDLEACGSRTRNAAETVRVEGELALAEDAGPAGRDRAEHCFGVALQIARSQRARSLELRAALSLARLWSSHGESARAIALLAPIHAAYDEGFDTADLMRASAMLAALRA